jgi:cytolysin-activating lysine-acyltransferase
LSKKHSVRTDREKSAQLLQIPATPAVKLGQEFAQFLGDVSWLMMGSPLHRHTFLADFEWLVLPAMGLKQVRLYRDETGATIAYISWALVSDEVNRRLQSGNGRLQASEWRSGPHPWIIDVVAPYGRAEELMDEFQRSVFAGKPVAVLPLKGKILGGEPPDPSVSPSADSHTGSSLDANNQTMPRSTRLN